MLEEESRAVNFNKIQFSTAWNNFDVDCKTRKRNSISQDIEVHSPDSNVDGHIQQLTTKIGYITTFILIFMTLVSTGILVDIGSICLSK